MNLDWDYIIRNYREIHRTCLTDGYLLPFVLSPAFIPPDNRLSYDEMKKITVDKEKVIANKDNWTDKFLGLYEEAANE